MSGETATGKTLERLLAFSFERAQRLLKARPRVTQCRLEGDRYGRQTAISRQNLERAAAFRRSDLSADLWVGQARVGPSVRAGARQIRRATRDRQGGLLPLHGRAAADPRRRPGVRPYPGLQRRRWAAAAHHLPPVLRGASRCRKPLWRLRNRRPAFRPYPPQRQRADARPGDGALQARADRL